MKIRKKVHRLLLISLIVPFSLFAQDEEAINYWWADTVTVEGLKNLQIPTVNAIATKMLLPLHDTPASVGVVTKLMLERQHATVLSDALKNISGVNVQHGTGTHDFFLIRGFESLSGAMVLTDGATEPEVSFYNMYNINRVEVLKGPAAFLYGGNPLSGAVNLSRKQPVFSNFARLGASYGEFNTYQSTADVGWHNEEGNVALRLNGMWQDSENYRDDKEHNTYAFNPAVTWKMSEKASVTLNFEYVRSNRAPDSGLPIQYVPDANLQLHPVFPDVRRKTSYQTPLDDSVQDMFRLRLDYKRQLNANVQLRNKFYMTRLDWRSTGAILNGAFPSDSLGNFSVIRTLNSLDDVQTFTGNQLEALISYNTGSIKHNLVTGIEVARLADDFDLDLAFFSPPGELNPAGSNLVLAIDLNNPVEFIQSREQLSFVDFAGGDATSLILAPYFINQAEITEQIQLFFGGRFDMINYDDDRSDFSFQTFQNVASENSRNYKRFSPMVGLVVAPIPDLSLYANAGQSFRPPSTLVVGDPKPEESTQYEVGAKYNTWGGRLNTTLAVFQLERQNIGIPDQTGVTQQNGDQQSKGVEFELAVQPVQGFNVFFNYAYTDAELTKFSEVSAITQQIVVYDGQTPAFAPKSIINFWATKDFADKFGVGVGFRYVGEQFIDKDNVLIIDDYLTFDASFFYTFENFRLSLNVKNLTDEDYLRRGGSGSSSVTPGNPRAIYTSLDFSL